MAWMIKHCQLVMANKGVALMANYGLEEEDDQFKGPLSYKQYLQHVLQHHFWGDEIILYAISCMWNLWITVLNSRTLEEYQIWHSFSLVDADVGIVYNCGSHYSAAGECWSHCFIYIGKLITLLVSLYGHMSGCLAIFHVCFGGQLAGHLGGHIAISHVYFGGHLGCRLSIKSVLHLIVVVTCTGGLVTL